MMRSVGVWLVLVFAWGGSAIEATAQDGAALLSTSWSIRMPSLEDALPADQETQAQEEVEEIGEIAELDDLLGEDEGEELERPFFRLDHRDLVITGFAFSTFRIKDETTSRTSFGLAPILLWKINDRMFLESELEITWNSASERTNVEIEYLDLSYIVNDYLTVSVGKFLVPFGIFSERLHPPWINKLPDGPLPVGHGGLVPGAAPGVMARGGFSVGVSKFNYAAYLVSGPALHRSGGSVGGLDFDHGSWNWLNDESDNFTNLAFGGRVGWLPVPEVEIGYSLYVAPNVEKNIGAVVQGVDATLTRDFEWLMGHVDTRFEWLWSDVDDQLYGSPGEYFGFENNRNGGYIQVAYRPSKVDNKIIRNFETVVRYDRITHPSVSGTSEQRYTVGVNYWFRPSVVLKLAYQIDDKRGAANDQNAFFVQFGWGLSDFLGVFQ